jgi:hypothetical protein
MLMENLAGVGTTPDVSGCPLTRHQDTSSSERMEGKTLCVYFGGTSSSYAARSTQIEAFGQWTQEDSRQQKLLFDGCGAAYGLFGSLFAFGLSSQVQQVVEKCEEMMEGEGEEKTESVRVIAVGLSRGGCACYLLARELQRRFGGDVSLSCLVFDPVPGNGIVSSSFDFFCFSLAGQTMDLRDCTCLTRVVALYPYLPLPDHLLHAPVFPLYPPSCAVEEEVILGCHQGAVYSYSLHDLERRLSFFLIHRYLTESGVRFAEGSCPFSGVPVTLEELLNDLDLTVASEKFVQEQRDQGHLVTVRGESVRHTHTSRDGGVIIRKRNVADYVNKWHRDQRKGRADARLLLYFDTFS